MGRTNKKLNDIGKNKLATAAVTLSDYMVASHYHDDHIGCTTEVLNEFPLQKKAYDRGGTYHSATFQRYVAKTGNKRTTATAGLTFTLDAGSAAPVTVEIVALNGHGIQTTNENDLSVVAVIRFGNFDAVIAGDLSGFKTGSYEDIETSVGPKIGQVEIYKVNHHGSRYSSNDSWLAAIKPKVGIISAGVENNYGHPTLECLDRLHAAGVKTYWTQIGRGAEPEPEFDVVGRNIVVETAPGSSSFTVTYAFNQTDTYPVWGAASDMETALIYAWSKRSEVYHFAECRYVQNISPSNLERGSSPPPRQEITYGLSSIGPAVSLRMGSEWSSL